MGDERMCFIHFLGRPAAQHHLQNTSETDVSSWIPQRRSLGAVQQQLLWTDRIQWHVFLVSCKSLSTPALSSLPLSSRDGTPAHPGAQYGQWQNVITMHVCPYWLWSGPQNMKSKNKKFCREPTSLRSDKSPSDPNPQACQRYLQSWWIKRMGIKKCRLENSKLLNWIC